MIKVQINDAIHKAIELTGSEVGVLNHAYMQRLRFIRQLGFVSLVYPTATHDRFSHALGTLHVASLMADQLLYNEEYSELARVLNDGEKQFVRRIIRLSAMLHDLGHGPFSHTAEQVMPPIDELSIPAQWMKLPVVKRRARHEDYTVMLVSSMSEGEHAVFSTEEAEIISSLVHHKVIAIPACWKNNFSKHINAERLHDIIKLIISSDIDADRMDYLLRDAHFAGVTYGHFDLPWLISNLGTIKNEDGYAMSISESGIHALEHYLLARYNMYAQVYMHKTVKCFEYYFGRSIKEGEIAYSIPSAVDKFARMRDSTLLESLEQAAAENPYSWAGRLMRREPAKRIARIWGDAEKVLPIFEGIYRDLDSYGVRPFIASTRSKFLDLGDAVVPRHAEKNPNESLFGGLASMPIRIVRNQFGVVSSAPLADYSFILKRYHQDIAVSDIYVLRDEYEARAHTIRQIIKKYYQPSASETIIKEEF